MIGLITFHWADDYGGMLQAYALKHYLEKHDEVKIIPYFPKKLQDRYTLIKTDSLYNFRMSLSSMLKVEEFSLRLKRRRNMRFFRRSFLTKEKPVENAFDIAKYDSGITRFVVGSDQIWNPEITLGLDDGYFCNFRNNEKSCKYIAYAASIGSERLDKEYDEQLKKRLENFDAISVREANIAPYISELYGKDVEAVCDPVFLLEKSEWESILNKAVNCKPYIFVYYTERNEKLIEYAKKLADEKGLEIRLFRQEYREVWSDEVHFMSWCSPVDFLTYLKNATYVITNSFHGLAFSVIFQKQLAVFTHSDKNARLNMLLSTAGLCDRIVEACDSFDIDKNINWENSHSSMTTLIDNSKKFIEEEIL